MLNRQWEMNKREEVLGRPEEWGVILLQERNANSILGVELRGFKISHALFGVVPWYLL